MDRYKIAIQGIEGSYHHMVSEEYFGRGNVDYLYCKRFTTLIEAISADEVDFGVMALENSIAGSILPNYNLLFDYKIKILSEYYMQIQHCLITHPDVDINDITEVRSHPMALYQCEEFISQHLPNAKVIDAEDTAAVAEQIKEKNLTSVAAIASQEAAERFGLKILHKSIQTIKDNQTRFAIVGKKSHLPKSKVTKISIHFEVKHKPGTLVQILTTFEKYNTNLTKLQSIPVINKPWTYAFIADFMINDYAEYRSIIQDLKGKTDTIYIIGEYEGVAYAQHKEAERSE